MSSVKTAWWVWWPRVIPSIALLAPTFDFGITENTCEGARSLLKLLTKKRVQLHKHSDILRLHSKSLNYTWSPNIKLCLVVQAAVYTGPWGYIQNVYVKSYSFKNLYIISLLFTRRHFPIERSKYLNRSKIHQECILSVCLQTKHTFLKHIYTLWTDKETRDKKRVSML